VLTIATPARLTMATFFMQATVLAHWFPRVPDVQAALGLSPAELAIALTGMPVSMFAALALSGRLIARFGPRLVMRAAFPAYCVAVALIGWSWDVPSLFAVMFVIGLSYPTIDVAMNVEAARIQAAEGRPIMNTCHGFWSIGSMAGAMLGAGFAQAAVDTRWHLLLVAAVSLVVAHLAISALPKVPSVPEERAAARSPFALPTMALIGLCIFVCGSVWVEGAARNWAAVYLRDVVAASPFWAGAAYGTLALFMAVGRFLGDRLTGRFGLVGTARACGLAAVAGVALVVVAPGVPVALAGFALAGLGISVMFPISMTAAAARGDRPAAINVAALALFASGAGLIGPALIGFVAEGAGLRVGMAVILPLVALSLLLAGELRK
jgi:MFS family permease